MIPFIIITSLINSETGSQGKKLGMELCASALNSIGGVGQRIAVQDPPLRKHETPSEIII
jgi:hypothetical protein